jgi:hypothetical protein
MSEKAPLTKERKGEIALAILKADIMGKAVTLNRSDLKRKLGVAHAQLKDQGVSKEELETLYEELILNAVTKMFTE